MKHIKMLLYGEPGVGKSVFASHAPKPFFITTDGNYDWLEDFGAKPEAHIQVSSWEDAKTAFMSDFKDYDTIVVDLLEDLFKWCEYEYCTRTKIDHVSDVGYGKGYDITRNEYFLEICKLLAKDKNVILITHGLEYTTKDRRGVEHTKYGPSNRLPDKVLDMLEGRLRYCLRCYLKAEESDNGELIKRRYLSLVPKENEFGIIRGVNENLIPHDIELDWNVFESIVNKLPEQTIVPETKHDISDVCAKEIKIPVKTVVENVSQMTIDDIVVAEPEKVTTETIKTVSDVIIEQPNEPVEEFKPKQMTQAEKIAAIKAKLQESRQ